MRLEATPCITPREFHLLGSGELARTGVLLVHGLTGTPNELRLLGRGLQLAGCEVYGVQLAGHCGSIDDLVATRWQDWVASVHTGAERLRARVDRLVVIGLSMGAVLALELAAERPELVDGVCALSTMFWHDGWSIPLYTRLSFMLRPVRALGFGRHMMFMEKPPYGIRDETLRKHVVALMRSGDSSAAGLPGNPWYSVIEMQALSRHVQRQLNRVRTPCLVVHASHDDVSSVANAELVVRRVQGPVDLVLLHDSYHMITIDRERRVVTERAIEFVTHISTMTMTMTATSAAVAGRGEALAT